MSNNTFLLSDEVMQKLADADAALADVVMGAMMRNDENMPQIMNTVATAGLALFEFQHDAVEAGLAERVMERSDVEEEANV